MKRLLIVVLIIFSAVFGYLFAKEKLFFNGFEASTPPAIVKKTILRTALIADSHNENGLLEKALSQAKGKGVNFVIGLGDYTNLGTLDELKKAKDTFEASKLDYYLTAGDRDGWESRRLGNVNNFESVFGKSTQVFEKEGIQFVLLDNSEIYKGINPEDWSLLEKVSKVSNVSRVSQEENYSATFNTSGTCDTCGTPKLTFVFVHKTPFHPESGHVMGEESTQVARQADELVKLIEESKVDGLFSGDLHFFAKFKSPNGSVKMTTVGAVSAERNFQGPRFAILTVFDDYSWEVEDVEIR